MLRLPFAALALLVAVSGCAIPSTVDRDLARAQHADSLGHTWTAYRLLRSAARGGSLPAQMQLAANTHSRGGLSGIALIVSPFPDAAEQQLWANESQRTARRLADDGDIDATGHEALGLMAFNGPDLSISSDERIPAVDYAKARRHFEAAITLGSRRASNSLAMMVWHQEGLLASEPYFQKSYDAGNREAAGMLAWIVMERPALERGLHSRDRVGDLSLVDIVGYVRVLRESGDPEGMEAADDRIDEIREQAQAGNAQSDSLLRAIDAAGLLGSRS